VQVDPRVVVAFGVTQVDLVVEDQAAGAGAGLAAFGGADEQAHRDREHHRESRLRFLQWRQAQPGQGVVGAPAAHPTLVDQVGRLSPDCVAQSLVGG
jgi:hypothetical protein